MNGLMSMLRRFCTCGAPKTVIYSGRGWCSACALHKLGELPAVEYGLMQGPTP